jgi:hypothetical protein
MPLIKGDSTTNITSATNAKQCVLNTTATSAGAIINDGGPRGNRTPGNELSIQGEPSNIVYLGATVSGPGVAPNTVIQGHKNARGHAGTYYVTPKQYVAPTTLTVAANGAVAGMPVKITAASGGNWSSVVGKELIVGPSPTSGTIPLKNGDGSDFDCSGLGTLSSMTLAYAGSENWINYLRRMSYVSPELKKYTYDGYEDFAAAGGHSPSQLTIAGPITENTSWALFSHDLYGYFPVATSTASTVLSTTLKLGGKVTGRYQVGQTIMGGGIPRDTTVVKILSGTGTAPGDLIQLSKSANVPTGVPINSVVIGPFPAYDAIAEWNRKR